MLSVERRTGPKLDYRVRTMESGSETSERSMQEYVHGTEQQRLGSTCLKYCDIALTNDERQQSVLAKQRSLFQLS